MLCGLQGLGMLLPTCHPCFRRRLILNPSLLLKISGAVPKSLWVLTIWQCHEPELCHGQAAWPGLASLMCSAGFELWKEITREVMIYLPQQALCFTPALS